MEYQELLDALLKEPIIGIDTETEEFNKDDKRYAFQLGLDGIGVYASEKVKGFIPVQELTPDFQKVLDTCVLVMHNAKFDLTILEKQGFDISNIKFHDTLIMSWLLNENRREQGLKALAKSILKYQNVEEFKEVAKKPNTDDFGMFPEDYHKAYKEWQKGLAKYCINDCKYTLKLYNKFLPELEQQQLLKDYEKVELPIIRALIDMENRGIKLDCEYLRKIGDKMEQEIIELQAEVYKNAGRHFDINSPKQLSEILFKEKKLVASDEFKTPKGEYSTNVHALNYLAETYPDEPLLQSLVKYREMYKLHSTYIKGLLEKQINGVMFTSFKQIGTATGRFTCSPNLQQLPRRNDEYDIRKAFIPRAGYCFVIADMSQIELRLIAHFSQDPNMLEAFAKGEDIHAETAKLMGCDRTTSKAINFGTCYGQGSYGLAKGLGISMDEANKFIKDYFSKFKRVEVLIEQAKNTVKKNYAVRTITMRKRRFPDYAKARKLKDWKTVSAVERQALNSLVQGSGSDIIKLQIRNLHQKLKPFDAHIVLQVHDELVVECPKEKAEEVMALVKFEMENVLPLKNVPIVANAFIADCYKK